MTIYPVLRGTALLAAVVVAVSGCSGIWGALGPRPSGTGKQSKFFSQTEFDKQMEQRTTTPEGPAEQPWLQMIDPQMVDTRKFQKAPPYSVCFSNAGVGTPWRVAGWKTMQAEVKLHPEIGGFTAIDAEGQDGKQISDIADLLANKKCDVLIVSPNTTDAVTPAVQKACQNGVPVILFDRGVTTDCAVTFIHPIGGYVFGAEAAHWAVAHVKKGGYVLALRTLPGVDMLETRWAAAKVIFDSSHITVVGVEFTNGDGAKAKSLVNDYLRRFRHIDAIWNDSSASAVAAAEAFEEAGKPVPPINGEDQNDWLIKWQKDKLTGESPTYPIYQWRTAIIAAVAILQGKPVPKEWVLPQPEITEANLREYADPSMPPLHYATCGCQKMPGYPDAWK
jgi:ribose transport system substrate-binding protein